MDSKKIISVTGACHNSGCTFVATSLAFTMAKYEEGITYLEGISHTGSHSLPMHELSLDRNISLRRLVDFFSLKAAGELTCNRVNLYGDVNWVVRFKESDIAITPKEVAGEYVIWDEPSDLKDSGLIICVIDVLPSKVLASKKTVDFFKEKHENRILWVFNKANENTDIKESEKFLGIKGDFTIPMQPQEDFYKAEESCTSLMDPGSRNNIFAPKPTLGLNIAMEELARYILTLY